MEKNREKKQNKDKKGFLNQRLPSNNVSIKRNSLSLSLTHTHTHTHTHTMTRIYRKEVK